MFVNTIPRQTNISNEQANFVSHQFAKRSLLFLNLHSLEREIITNGKTFKMPNLLLANSCKSKLHNAERTDRKPQSSTLVLLRMINVKAQNRK